MTIINQVIVDREVPCIVRDGVTLYANIYRPKGVGTYPVLLTRLPYNKNLPDFSHRYIDPMRFALAGYVVIIQDVRGRFASEGDFEPFMQEFEDGYDTVEWAAKLPYSNGQVGMFGLSYYGFTQLYAALERPPSLKVIFPAMTGNLSKGGLFNRNGVTELAAIETWMLDSIAPDYLQRTGNEDYSLKLKEIIHDLDHIDEWYNYKPIQEWPPVKKHPELALFYTKYFMDAYDEELLTVIADKSKSKGELDIPAYHLAGWYDSHLSPTLLNYEDMFGSKRNQKLMIGPWSHGLFDSDIAERSFGMASSGHFIDGEEDLTTLHINWFDHWLKEKNVSIKEKDYPVKLFVMGINEWRSEEEWPLKRTNYTPFYFGGDGRAAETLDSGRLTLMVPKENQKDRYIHDPHDPVPSLGGGTIFYKGRNAGPRDQQKLEERADVVVYTSAPLKDPLEVTGWITVSLWASTDAVDTDFTAKLVDVLPDGRAYNLADGIVRVKYHDEEASESTLDGEIVNYKIDLWATSNVFLPGHSIRIEIASSNFPRFDVNPNTGGTTADSITMVKANQVIYHGPMHPSHVLLPVIPNKNHI